MVVDPSPTASANDTARHGSDSHGAEKQRPRARAPRTTMARTEVKRPVHGGETLSSIGNELVETPLPQDFCAPPWRGGVMF